MSLPFLITGCGRSGTLWAARLFTALGYPTGHEEAFSYERSGPLTAPEASWLAVPHLASLDPRTPLLRILRDPYAVVQSAVAKGFLADLSEPFAAYVAQHRPDIASPDDHLSRVIRWVVLWDEPLDSRGYWPLRAEDSARSITLAMVAAVGNAPPLATVGRAMADLGTTINTPTEPRERPSLDAIKAHGDAALLAKRASRFGYARHAFDMPDGYDYGW